MNRAVRALASAALLAASGSFAEPTRRVGLIWNSPPQAEVEHADPRSRHPGRWLIHERLRELGWQEGRNLETVSRSAEGRYERFPEIVDEMVARRVNVIVVFSREGLRVAQARAPAIPAILSVAFNSPGGRSADRNVTGMAAPNPVAKRLEMLKSLAPETRRVAMVARVAPGEKPPTISGPMLASARGLGLELFALYFAEPGELEAVFAEARRRQANAMYMSLFPRLTWDEEVQRKVVGLAALHRLPTVYELPLMANRGGLVAFGLDDREVHRKTADYVDRLLRGASPSQLPLEEPMRFLLRINAPTARELGLTIPPPMRVLADDVLDREDLK